MSVGANSASEIPPNCGIEPKLKLTGFTLTLLVNQVVVFGQEWSLIIGQDHQLENPYISMEFYKTGKWYVREYKVILSCKSNDSLLLVSVKILTILKCFCLKQDYDHFTVGRLTPAGE